MNLIISKDWSEVYVHQFISIRTMDYDATYSGSLEILSILTDRTSDDDIWDDMDIDDMNNIINNLLWLRYEPSKYFKRNINNLEIIDINKLTFGEFLDLEYLFNDYYNNFTKICATLYRKVKDDEWGIKRFEPYPDYNIEDRSLLFEELYITDVWGVIKYYLDLKKLINETYDLWEPEIDEEDVELDEEDKVEEEKEKVFRNWAWENVLHNLSGGDITKYDEILSKPIIFILNQLSFRKDMKI